MTFVSRECHTATWPGVALTKAGQSAFHDTCPGVCETGTGTVVPCGCECHGSGHSGSVDLCGLPARIPEAIAVSAPAPVSGDQDRLGAPDAPNGRCEHCGAPTGGRFAPGHDAKLKSQLWAASKKQMDYKSFAEMIVRGWAMSGHFHKVDINVEMKAREYADTHGWTFVNRRNAWRKEHGEP